MCLAPISHRKDGSPLVVSYTCGHCFECYKKRAIEWAVRVGHELASHEDNIFLTLTYDDKKKSETNYLYEYQDFQNFIKLLRYYNPKRRIKYFTSIEYGGQHGRLHYHTILFNYHPRLNKGHSTKGATSPSGFQMWNNTFLEKLWPHGFHSFSEASVETGYYIASYALSENTFVNDNGEILSDKLKPSQGIGLDFFLVNMENIIEKAFWEKTSIPRYYRRKIEAAYPLQFKQLENLLVDIKQRMKGREDDTYQRIINFEKRNSKMLFRNQKPFEFDDYKTYYRK